MAPVSSTSFLLARIAQAGHLAGIRAVLVHAIDDEARVFYLHHGFQPSPVDPLQLMMLMKDLRASRGFAAAQ